METLMFVPMFFFRLVCSTIRAHNPGLPRLMPASPSFVYFSDLDVELGLAFPQGFPRWYGKIVCAALLREFWLAYAHIIN
jgi:hypothetical protein